MRSEPIFVRRLNRGNLGHHPEELFEASLCRFLLQSFEFNYMFLEGQGKQLFDGDLFDSRNVDCTAIDLLGHLGFVLLNLECAIWDIKGNALG
jgi:hypothetical protein